MASPWQRVGRGPIWRRRYLTRRDWALLDDVSREVGIPLNVVQGSWSGGRKSAGTHTGAGAFDISTRGMSRAKALEVVNELRKRNVAAWFRSREFGWRQGDHIHGIVKDTPGLAYGAKRQVINYNDGLNGLSSRRRDPHPRPAQRKFIIDGMSEPPVVTKPLEVRLRNLRYGQRNDDVKDLQKALKITQDGVYGPVTDAAVRAHQKRMGLVPDPKGKSYVGPKQAKALGLKVV